MSSGLPAWDSALLCKPQLLRLIQQLYSGKTGFLLCAVDEVQLGRAWPVSSILHFVFFVV